MDESNEDQRTVWCGNLSEKITEEILYELFLQTAPLERVHIPKDKHGNSTNYGFVTFKHLCSVPYAVNLLNGISLYNKKINIKPRCRNTDQPKIFQQSNDVRAPPFTPVVNNVQTRIDPFENIDLLMHLGNQLLLNNNRHYFAGDYRNERPSNNQREYSHYHDNRREQSRRYRRRNNHYHNDRYNSN
ncbi:hypothetical protein RN001_004220 [Aquatica leii]|uniref:RRM domain-containing protein n=1 Tax=Aquatica leii TaxID=1421715 RepID=A0AAN7PE61_9COLE|nr:hypothetical protein RN001_004220 [Aquatica leii]